MATTPSVAPRAARASTPDELSALRVALDAVSRLGPHEHAAIAELATTRDLAAREHLLCAGARAEHGALVIDGALREYWPLPDGTERTKGFALDGAFVGSLADLISASPSLRVCRSIGWS